MREYNVYFSFYSEEYGNFDDVHYPVMAGSPFEAREKAWKLCDEDSETLFRSNIRQFAVTWIPNKLDAGDYFYTHASDIKCSLGALLNVSIPNDHIRGGENKNRLDAERCSCLSALQTLNDVAKDLYADKGINPPSIYEELHYAEKLCEQLGWNEKADALWERMEKAKKWDAGAIYSIRNIFKEGYTILCGKTELVGEHFDRNGIYPVQNKTDEYDFDYIYRWQHKPKVDSMRKLMFFKETNVIKNSSDHMVYYRGQVLLMDYDKLKKKYQTPENLFWTATGPSENGESDKNGVFYAENLITGECTDCFRGAFSGILRPDIVARIDFDALKNEYAAIYCEDTANDRGTGDYDTDTEDDEFER